MWIFFFLFFFCLPTLNVLGWGMELKIFSNECLTLEKVTSVILTFLPSFRILSRRLETITLRTLFTRSFLLPSFLSGYWGCTFHIFCTVLWTWVLECCSQLAWKGRWHSRKYAYWHVQCENTTDHERKNFLCFRKMLWNIGWFGIGWLSIAPLWAWRLIQASHSKTVQGPFSPIQNRFIQKLNIKISSNTCLCYIATLTYFSWRLPKHIISS